MSELGQVCGHGQLARSCNICDLEVECDRLREQLKQLQEAEKEWNRVRSCAECRNEALEMAAKIVETPMPWSPLQHAEDRPTEKCYPCDCHGECPQEWYPPIIRELKT